MVLLINGAVTGSVWAADRPAEGGAEAHAHCFDAVQDEAPTSRQDCCSPGACHCLTSNLSASVGVLPVRVPVLLHAALVGRNQDGLPAPTLTRHFRPPISALPGSRNAAGCLA